MEDNYTVYAHINKINGKIYIGITGRKPSIRWKNGNGYKSQIYFNNAIDKYGWDNFDHEIIASNLIKKEAEQFEILLISVLKSNIREFGYNTQLGGNLSSTGISPTKKTREKMSNSHKGKHIKEKNNMFGKHHSDKVREKISKELKNKYISERNWSSKKVICTTTNMIFNSMTDASKYYSMPVANISQCCLNERMSGGTLNGEKLQWEFYYENVIYIKNKYVNPKCIKVYCITTDELFDSIKEASIYYNVQRLGIKACCIGDQKYSGKLKDGTRLIWRYATKFD